MQDTPHLFRHTTSHPGLLSIPSASFLFFIFSFYFEDIFTACWLPVEMSTLEKKSGAVTDDTSVEADSALAVDNALTEEEQALLLRRIDLRLLPMLFLIYVMAFLDR